MTPGHWLAIALAAGALSHADTTAAQPVGGCPSLPDASGLRWNALERPGLTLCKAIRDSDGSEVFTVVLAGRSPFVPSRRDREEKAVIDGHEIRWYRGQIATDPNVQVRETLIELEDGRVAHLSLRAPTTQSLPEFLRQAESIRFEGVKLSSK